MIPESVYVHVLLFIVLPGVALMLVFTLPWMKRRPSVWSTPSVWNTPEPTCPHCGHFWCLHKTCGPDYDDYQCQHVGDWGHDCHCSEYEDEQE